MLRSLPFGRTVIVLLAIGFLALLAVAGGATWLTGTAARDAQRVTDAQAIQGAAITVYLAVRETESGQRGYLLTDDPAYLDVYSLARRGAEPAISTLVRLTAEDPVQAAEVAKVLPIVRAKLAEMNETVELARTGRKRQAVAVVRTDEGRTMTFAIGEALGRVIARETERLVASQTSSRRNSNLILIAQLVAIVLVVLLASITLGVVGRSLAALRASGRELTRINAGLEEAVQERTREISRANEEIQRFAYIVSHDLRSPLVNVMGFTSELETGGVALRRQIEAVRASAPELLDQEAALVAEEDLPESLGFIRASTAKMDRLINAILDLSRGGRRTLAPAPVEMKPLLEQAAASLTVLAERQGATITVDVVPDLVSDKLAIEQIFSNLMENAVKYLQPGRHGRIVVRGRQQGNRVVYEVEDNGRGIDSRDHARVFELFRRAGAQDQPGEGLGLAFVQSNVRRLGGSIDLKSTLGEGSTFTLTFPKVLTVNQTQFAQAA